MKKTITTVAMLLISVMVVSAQKLQPNSLIKATHTLYKTDSSKLGGMFIRNERNLYHHKISKAANVGDNLVKSDSTSLIRVFKTVFSQSRMKQLINQDLWVEYVVANDGKILEVSFVVSQNTTITVKEIEKLEEGIKNNVSFKWHGRSGKPGDFFVLYQPIRFSKILDGTFPG